MKRTVIFVVESGGMAGGVRQIFEQANRLSDRGWPVRIFSLDAQSAWFRFGSDVEWRRFPDYHHLKTVLVAEEGLKIATWWKTAGVVAECLRGDEGIYLVADIEADYYTRPSQREQVMNTYSLPLRRYTESRWVEGNLPDTTWVGIGLDHSLYHPLALNRIPSSLLAIPRKQRLKGYRQLGELSRRLGNEFNLITIGVFDAKFLGAWKKHYVGLPDYEVVRLYNQVMCFVSTTLHEGFGLPHLEAMACGTPVITTDADSNMEFCDHGRNCLVYKHDEIDKMAHGIRRVLADETLWRSLVHHGLKTAQEYQWEPVIDRLEKFLSA